MSEVRGEERLGEREAADEAPDQAPPSRLGLRALAQDTAIYGGTRVAVKSLAFLLIPLYARFLTPAQFGVLELILAISALLDVFVNLPGTLARFYFDKDEPRWRREVISLYFGIEAIYPALLIGALILFSDAVADNAVGGATYAGLLVISLCDLYLTNIVDLPMSLARLRRKPFTFAFYALTRALVQVVFSVLLVAVWHLEVKGILLASLISVCVTFVVSLREYVGDLTRRVSLSVAKEMIEFSWPTILTGLAFYVLNFVDRFFIKHYHGLADNGLYGTAYRYSQIVFVAVVAFRLGWPQWHYSWLHSGRHPQMVAQGARYYLAAIGFLAVLVSLWILPLFHLIMPAAYWSATVAVPPLALAAVAAGCYTVVVVSFQVEKRMRQLLPVTTLGALFAVGLLFLLVPPFSFQGAAWATAASLALLTVLAGLAGRRIYPIPWAYRQTLSALAVTAALAVAAVLVDREAPFEASLGLRALLTLVYPAAIVVLGVFSRDELRRLRRLRTPGAP